MLHRLTQAILRDRLTPEQAADTRGCSEAILAAADPGDTSNPVTWPRWAQLMPHPLAADPAATENPALRWMASSACRYLLARGDILTAHVLAAGLHQQWRDRLGDDHPDTLTSANNLAAGLSILGEHQAARELDEDTLARRRRVLGDDHPRTLTSASNLAADLNALGKTDKS